MRIMVSLFLVLISFAGMIVPCCGSDECCSSAIALGDHDEEQKGGCSPFFACSSCPGFVCLSRPIQLSGPESATTSHFAKQVAINLASFPAARWQPPRA